MNNFDFIKILRILSQKVAHAIAALYFVQIWSLTILSLKFEQFKILEPIFTKYRIHGKTKRQNRHKMLNILPQTEAWTRHPPWGGSWSRNS